MRKILVEIRVPEVDSAGHHIEKENDDGDLIPQFNKIQGYLHHWGMQFETWVDREGGEHVGQYTVAIVEDAETGVVHTFQPTDIKVIGSTTYK